MIVEKICCLGAGFLGGTFSSVLALKCPEIEVQVVDENQENIDKWNSDRIPVFEPDLEDIVKKRRGKNLFFTSDVSPLKGAQVIFVCANAKTGFQSSEEIKAMEDAAHLIVKTVDSSKIIVEKSTVAVHVAEMMTNILRAHESPTVNFTLVSNPEFLKEGFAVNELLHPDRVLIGGENTMRGADAVEAVISIYMHWVPRSNIITSDLWTVELSNLAEMAFLAQKITSVNSIIDLCEAMGANATKVIDAIGKDPRLGAKDLEKCAGFRGVNYYKTIQSIKSIIYLCKCLRLPDVANYWQKLLDVNEYQKGRSAKKIMNAFGEDLTDKYVAVLGFCLSKDATSTRDSASIYVCRALLEKGAKLKICEWEVPKEVIYENLEHVLYDSPVSVKVPEMVETFDNPYEATTGAQALVITTDWSQLVDLDFNKIFEKMLKPAYIFDSKKVLQHKELQDIGFEVQTFGTDLAIPPTVNVA